MKPAPFTYYRPSTLDEAAELLADSGGKVLAGGQSLVPIMSMRLASPSALIDLNHIQGYDDVVVDDEAVTDRLPDSAPTARARRRGARAQPSAASGARVGRASDHPQPGYDGRQPRAC